MTKIKNHNLPFILLIVTVCLFITSQLVVNSILAPLGIELQSLNSEKNYLIEENRAMEEEIAKTNSITIVKKLANERLNISSNTDKNVIYVENNNLLAERP